MDKEFIEQQIKDIEIIKIKAISVVDACDKALCKLREDLLKIKENKTCGRY